MSSGRQAGGKVWVSYSNCDEHICTEGGSCKVCRIAELEAQVDAGYETGWHALRQERDELKAAYKHTVEDNEDLVRVLDAVKPLPDMWRNRIEYEGCAATILVLADELEKAAGAG